MEELFPCCSQRSGVRDIRLGTVCFGLEERTNKNTMAIVGLAVDDIAGGRDEVWEQAISKLKQRFTFGHCEVGKKDNFAVVRWSKQQMDPCVLGSLLTSRAWTLCPSRN